MKLLAGNDLRAARGRFRHRPRVFITWPSNRPKMPPMVRAHSKAQTSRPPRRNTTRRRSPIQCSRPPCGTSLICGLILNDFEVNPTNTLPLIKDLTEAAQGTKPSAASVARLAQDSRDRPRREQKLHAQHQKLAQNVHAMFNSSHLSPAHSRRFWTPSKRF